MARRQIGRAVSTGALLGLLAAFASPMAGASAATKAEVIQLTEADSGRTLQVHHRQQLQVTLPGGSFGGYHQSTSSGPAVRRISAAGGYPSDEPATALFVAEQHGTADLQSLTDYTCLHEQPPCAIPQKIWIVHIVVR
jgi:hypothetical protein